jgi:hypothetical protein
VSRITAPGWLAFIAEDPEDGEGPEVATYCPPCADRELRPVENAVGYGFARLKIRTCPSFSFCSCCSGSTQHNSNSSLSSSSKLLLKRRPVQFLFVPAHETTREDDCLVVPLLHDTSLLGDRRAFNCPSTFVTGRCVPAFLLAPGGHPTLRRLGQGGDDQVAGSRP